MRDSDASMMASKNDNLVSGGHVGEEQGHRARGGFMRIEVTFMGILNLTLMSALLAPLNESLGPRVLRFAGSRITEVRRYGGPGVVWHPIKYVWLDEFYYWMSHDSEDKTDP